MVNIPIIPPVSDKPLELLPDISQTWKVGQVLNATVERGGENLDRILLRIGQHVLESKTPMPLKTGEQIKVLIKALGETPLLAIQTEATLAQRAAGQLRQFIAPQQDWRPLLELASKLLTSQRLPAAAQPQLQQLLQNLPDVEQLSQPQTLQKIMVNSGVLLESRLAASTGTPEQDFKAQLQRLQPLLQQLAPTATNTTRNEEALDLIQGWLRNPAPPPTGQLATQLAALVAPVDMHRLISAIESMKLDTPLSQALLQLFAQVQKHQGTARLENLVQLLTDQAALDELKTAVNQAVSHISQQQLLPLVRDADSALLLLFGLPLRHDNQLHWIDFRIERENASQADTEPGWNVTLNFDIPELGPLQARLHLQGRQLATTLRANQPATLDKIRQYLPLLHQALLRAGLEVTKLDVVAGVSETPLPLTGDIRLLDEQA